MTPADKWNLMTKRAKEVVKRSDMGKTTRLQRIVGRWRLWWNLCPACNSDAPEVDTCPVCKAWDDLTPYGRCPPDAEIKSLWWSRFTVREYVPNNEADKLIILKDRSDIWLRLFSPLLLKVVRAFVDRAFERNFINSRAYHDLHAMADRVFKHETPNFD